jgi:hypothetical protein
MGPNISSPSLACSEATRTVSYRDWAREGAYRALCGSWVIGRERHIGPGVSVQRVAGLC